nr:alpha/beta hydrolase [Lachnospiraceae bacterium]
MKKKTVINDASASKWNIHPDFKNLKRIPVPRTLSQVRSIQLIFRRRMHRETSTEHFDVKRIKLKSAFSQKKEIRILIYSSKNLSPDEKAPCLYFIHGGAFLLPALPYHYRFARFAAKELHCRVIMPMYDLAPYQVPPIQQEEIFEIYNCLIDNPEQFHINPDKIIAAGDSAGGTLAAALCLMARDRNVQLPLAQ